MSTHHSAEYVPCRSLPGDKRQWYAFLIVSVATPFVVAIPVVLWHICNYLFLRFRPTPKEPSREVRGKLSWRREVGLNTSMLISDQSVIGQCLKFLAVLLAIGSLIIYWQDTAPQCIDVEMCQDWNHNVWWQVDLAFNCYFLLYYILRFIASQHKLHFIFEIFSVVDYFSVPPTFVAAGLDRNWHGLRFLRIINLLWLSDLMHRVGVITTVAQVQFSRLVVYICIAIVVGAGSFLLLECSGDPWDIDGTLQQNTTFWNMAYFSVVTISTVGYGDIGMHTVLGRIFCSLYIFACLISGILIFVFLLKMSISLSSCMAFRCSQFFIASFIATAASLIPPPRRHPKFETSLYYNHVILCGNVTSQAVLRFLQNFYHSSRPKGTDETYVIVLHPDDPDDEMVLLLNEYQVCVEYVRGTPLRDADLEECRASLASSCIILADQRANNPDAEDAKIVLHAVAVKNYCPTLRIQVQVLLPSTATFLKNYPPIHSQHGDVVTCQKNIEAGLAGMSCTVPGFATLFCNLVTTSFSQSEAHADIPKLYERGCNMRLTCVKFSPTFYGMTFLAVAEFCHSKLDVLLVALYTKGQRDIEFHNLTPNPANSCLITDEMIGQVIASSDHHAQVVAVYCKKCHGEFSVGQAIGICSCYQGVVSATPIHLAVRETHTFQGMFPRRSVVGLSAEEVWANDHPTKLKAPVGFLDHGSISGSSETLSAVPAQLDSSGLFHWCPAQEFSSCLLTATQAEKRGFSNHIIIFLLSNPDSAEFGLHNVMMPNRASHIPFEELRDILIVGEECALAKEWHFVRSFPKMMLLAGHPATAAVIRGSNVDSCRACILLGDNYEFKDDLVDKDVIVMNLRLRSRAPSIKEKSTHGHRISDGNFPIYTMLDTERGVRYLSQQPDRIDYRFTWPFMEGTVIIGSLMELLVVPAYFNPSLVKLFSCLVFGGSSPGLEQVAAEGMGTRQVIGHQGSGSIIVANGQHVTTTMKLIEIESPLLRSYAGRRYGDLFSFLLQDYGVLCIGLYRVWEGYDEFAQRRLRYVVTHPPTDESVRGTDQLYILLPAVIA